MKTPELGNIQETQNTLTYFEHSRSLPVSFMFILPLMLVYEIGVVVLRPEHGSLMSNLIWVAMYSAFGRFGPLAFNLCLMVGVVVALLVMRPKGGVRLIAYLGVLGESIIYGGMIAVMLPFVMSIAIPLMQGGPGRGMAEELLLSIGAGVYEEIVFRLMLMSAIYYVSLQISRINWLSVTVAILLSSVIFSICHFLGGVPEVTSQVAYSFIYLTLCGVLFAGIYIYRGLAIACYTHAFYNILIIVAGLRKV